jgi:hypothetical protein
MRIVRWTGAGLLIVLSALLVVASVAARFARSEVLNTDRYVETVAPLATNPGIQAAISTRVTTAIVDKADIPALVNQLAGSLNVPGAQTLAGLAGPALSNWVEGQVSDVVDNIVTSSDFEVLWININRSAHTQVQRVLTGEDTGAAATTGNNIVLDLGVIFDAVRDRLVQRGWTFLSKIPNQSIPYTVATIDNLSQVQRYVSLLDKAGTWLPILALGLLGLAVWCAPNSRRALLVGLIVTVVTLLLTMLAYKHVRDIYATRAAERGFNVTNSLTVWDTVLAYFVRALQTVTVTAALAALWTFLAGPGRLATGFRRGVNRALDPVARLIGPHERLRTAARRWLPWVAVLIAVLGLWWLLAVPTIGTAVTVVILAAILTALFTIARHLPDQRPPATPTPA